MRIREKFILMTAFPILAILLILIIGWLSFIRIQSSVEELNKLQNDRSTMIDADRDAYQAFLAGLEAVRAGDEATVELNKAIYVENSLQTWDRITGPAVNFREDMTSDLESFKKVYAEWNTNSEMIIQLAQMTVGVNAQTAEKASDAIAAFELMREEINLLGEKIDGELSRSLSDVRRRELEQALSMTLNGDRDAYQAYVAQLLIPEAETLEEVLSLDESSLENIGQTSDRVEQAALIFGGEGRAIQDRFGTYFADWKEHSRQVVDGSKKVFEENRKIVELSLETASRFNTMRDLINSLGEKEKEHVDETNAEVADLIRNTVVIYIIIAGIAILGTIVFVGIISVQMINAITKGVSYANLVSTGDLGSRLNIAQKDEIGELATSLNRLVGALELKETALGKIATGDLDVEFEMVSGKDQLGKSLIQMRDSLTELISRIVRAVNQVQGGANQISDASQVLSQGATEQAASIEQISASINEVNGQSRQNSDSAAEATSLARQAADDAGKGSEEMAILSAAMEKINSSSDQIKKIVKVIADIAFQTNLLALNANVEAARAGKYGKGFAVVAEEVRNLAVRSGEAVNETTGMVDESVRNIAAGYQAAEKTAVQLNSILEGSGKVAEFLEKILVASKEQTDAIAQISQGLDQIDQVTQANTASAEESAAASEELSSQSVRLKDMVASFRLRTSLMENNGSKKQLSYAPDDVNDIG
jgi:methyl-accepting chemotaxis protein